MGRPKSVCPKLYVDKTRNRAFTKVDGRFVVLGPAGSVEAQQRYADILAEHAAGRHSRAAQELKTASKLAPLTINELFLEFVTRELPRFSRSEQLCFKTSMRVCRQLFGQTFVRDFGPVRFRSVRDAMVQGASGESLPPNLDGSPAKDRQPWSRKTANRQAKRIRQIFRWGVSWELVPVEVLHRLDTVRGLAVGETAAAESVARLAVPEADIQAVRDLLKPYYRDVLDLLLLTGARPGEILALTGAMLERRPDGVWLAELHEHKTARKGKRRFLVFNMTAQAILLRYLKTGSEERLFPHRRDNFTAAIKRACRRAHVKEFCAHQLRHTTAARLVDNVGLEAAKAVLGHSELAMTLHYSRSAERSAVEAVKQLG